MTLAIAHSRGWLDYEERVAHYWPEFAQHGKEAIVCAVDFRPSSLAALRYALSLAQQGRQRLQLVTVIDTPWAGEVRGLDEERAERATMREALLDRVPDNVRQVCLIQEEVLRGAPAEALLTYAGDVNADLIVMGTGDHGHLHKLWLGSTTAKVMRSTACPVLIVPAPRPPVFAEAAMPPCDMPPGWQEDPWCRAASTRAQDGAILQRGRPSASRN